MPWFLYGNILKTIIAHLFFEISVISELQEKMDSLIFFISAALIIQSS